MIIDNIKNIDIYKFENKNLIKAFEYIKNKNFQDKLTGKIEVDGDKLYAIISEYIPKTEADILWEAHKNYIDVQYIIEGEELIGYTSINNLDIVKPYNFENDVLLGNANGSYFKLKEGDFVVFFPEEVHKPGIISNLNLNVKKIVIKVKV